MRNTTLCYLERDGKVLMLFRNRKKNDVNKGKWIGIGGKFEEGESPEECAARGETIFYSTWPANLASYRTAIRAGFLPVNFELGSTKA